MAEEDADLLDGEDVAHVLQVAGLLFEALAGHGVAEADHGLGGAHWMMFSIIMEGERVKMKERDVVRWGWQK